MKRLLSLAALFALGFSLVFAGGRQSSGSTQRVTPAPGPLGKYNPPITVTFARGTSATDRYDGDYTVDRNEWTIENENELGIITKYLWTANQDQFDQKMAASIATGDLPDIMSVNMDQFDMLTRSGLIWDLTDVYNQYASDIMKNAMGSAPQQLATAKAGDKLMAIPQLGSTTDCYVGWVRTDWLAKVGLQVPKTLADLKRVAQAFMTQDPDGNGKNDTMGLGFTANETFAPVSYMTPFFAMYHAYINGWIPDGQGGIVSGLIQPEVKTALADIAEMYKQGLIARDWSTTDYATLTEQWVSGKLGLMIGDFGDPVRMPKFITQNPGADWMPFPIPSIDDQQMRLLRHNPVSSYYVVNKKFQNPEALIKLCNYMYEFYYGTSGILEKRPYLFQSVTDNNILNWSHNVVHTWLPDKNLLYTNQIREGIKNGRTDSFNDEQKGYYNMIVRYDNGDIGDGYPWSYRRIFGPDQSSYTVIQTYVDNNQLFLSSFYGPPTSTMKTNQSTLDSLRDEVFTNIINGMQPISAFDTFVANWKSQGGDQITKEVNEWYRQNR
jgi:putative aldouronate transport system substrate-binding protein